MRRIIFIFVLLLVGVSQQALAQQTVSTEDFEINLPEGWSYRCSEETGIMKHFFLKDSISYTVNVFSISVYSDNTFMNYLPQGTKYVKPEEEQVIRLEDSTEMKYRKVQGDVTNPKVSGCVYVTDRNDKTIIVQEINRDGSKAVKDALLDKFRWTEIASLTFHERVHRFCNVLNGLLGKFAPSEGISFIQSDKKKILYIEQRLQNPEDEAKVLAKGKLKKKDKSISEMFDLLPLFLEMGYNGYSFQMSRYLMNGKRESKVVYKPKDYKHLIAKKNETTSFTIRLTED